MMNKDRKTADVSNEIYSVRNQRNSLAMGKIATTDPTHFFPSFDSMGKGGIDNAGEFKKNKKTSSVLNGTHFSSGKTNSRG